jgi:transcriptional regulator with XRE-family HTH domain
LSAALDLTLGHHDGTDMAQDGATQRTRIHANYSSWTGAELRERVRLVHISGRQFARITGIQAETFEHWARGDRDGNLPLWVELVIELLERSPPMRHTARAGGHPDARHSTWTGADLKRRLSQLGVAGRQFARMTGLNATSVERWMSGKSDGDIPLWVEVVVDLLERFPDTRTRERRESGRKKVVLDGKPRDPRNFPPPRAKPWPEMQRLLETAKPTVSTMTDTELLAEYHAFDAMDDGPISDENRARWDLVSDECFKRGLA